MNAGTVSSQRGHPVLVAFGGGGARAAWARLLELDSLSRLDVVVAEDSPLCRSGWIGILAVDGTVTASVPSAHLRTSIEEALAGLSPEDAVCVEVVQPRLPATRSVLGPVALFYPPPDYTVAESASAEQVSKGELESFARTARPDELEESGLLDVTSPVFASRTPEGELMAVCGYRRWPNDVAHLSALTVQAHRRKGHGRRAALGAITHAVHSGLLPRWRARPSASQSLAHSLGSSNSALSSASSRPDRPIPPAARLRFDQPAWRPLLQ